MSNKKGSAKVLPIADVLHDLAVLRALGTEIPESLLKSSEDIPTDASSPVASSVLRSYEYAEAARKAIKLHDSGKMDSEGVRLDDIRSKLEDLLDGIDTQAQV